MIEIKHRLTEEVLHRVDAESLRGADLWGARLQGADLRGADLQDATLSGVDLRDADLRDANLGGAILFGTSLTSASLEGARIAYTVLIGASLHGANVKNADLSNADLLDADLRKADLTGSKLMAARLVRARLDGADLSEAFLNEAVLGGTSLVGTEMEGAFLGGSTFINCITLHEAKGLSQINHHGPSALDVLTLRACVPHLPDAFLQGVGYSDHEIGYLRSLYTAAIQFYSCFLCHGEVDQEFVDRLRRDLIAREVTCWHFRYDMLGGRPWPAQVSDAIKVHDKLIVVCSMKAVQRMNVVVEILQAMERERRTGSQVLFPIRLDDFILTDGAAVLAKEKVRSGEWREDWVDYVLNVRKYHIPDFSRWKDHDAYTAEFEKLLKALKRPPRRKRRSAGA